MELLDILNEEGELTGKKEERSIVHKKGLWHIHVGVWMMNENGELLFQKRSAIKKVNPNRWTRTGGHVDSGETPLIGVQREVQEEVGVNIPLDKFELINIEKNATTHSKHFTHNYFVLVNYKIDEYTMQQEEVSDLKYITIEEMERAIQEHDTNYTFVDWKNIEKTKEIFEYLKNKRKELLGQKQN